MCGMCFCQEVIWLTGFLLQGLSTVPAVRSFLPVSLTPLVVAGHGDEQRWVLQHGEPQARRKDAL